MLMLLAWVPSVLLVLTQAATITITVTDESGSVLPGMTGPLTSEALRTGTSVTTTNEYEVYRFMSNLTWGDRGIIHKFG